MNGRHEFEMSAQLDRLVREPPRRGQVAAHQPLIGADRGEQRLDGAVGLVVGQVDRPPHPRPDRRHQPGVDQQEQGDHGGRSGRATTITLLAQHAMLLLPRRDRGLEITIAIRRTSPHLDQFGCPGRVAGRIQQGETIRPATLSERRFDLDAQIAHRHIVTRNLTPSRR